MRLAALALAGCALLAPAVVAAPPRPPALVAIAVGEDRATGFVAGQGKIVTVSHVLGDGVVTVDGRPARIIRRDERLDLALLAVDGIAGEPPRIASAPGTVWVGGRRVAVSRRMAARIDGSHWRRPALELRGRVGPGDSGAPLLTPTGRVAGVVFARSRTRAGIAYAVDGAMLANLIESAP